MKPYKIEVYVYAETDDEAMEAQRAMRDFVRSKYNMGILVTAKKLIGALTRFKDNIVVNQFLK
jgi:hypothetical protein